MPYILVLGTVKLSEDTLKLKLGKPVAAITVSAPDSYSALL